MKIKICGIKEQRDLEVCENARADLIGFINIKRSKRMIEIEKIKNLISSMKDKNKAVLVIEPLNVADAEEKIIKSGIRNIQLHSLSSDEISSLKENFKKSIHNKPGNREMPNNNLTIIRAVGLSEIIDSDKKTEIQDFADVCDYLTFDYEIQEKRGDWECKSH